MALKQMAGSAALAFGMVSAAAADTPDGSPRVEALTLMFEAYVPCPGDPEEMMSAIRSELATFGASPVEASQAFQRLLVHDATCADLKALSTVMVDLWETDRAGFETRLLLQDPEGQSASVNPVAIAEAEPAMTTLEPASTPLPPKASGQKRTSDYDGTSTF